MAISDAKLKIVIENYFKDECNVNTSIREAYTRGFERGLSKAEKHGHWIEVHPIDEPIQYECSVCGNWDVGKTRYCCYCGAKMEGEE